MHKTAEENAKRFFNTYVSEKKEKIKILEIGSYIGGFNIRSLNPENGEYIGVDLSKGPGVDIVLTDEYVLPFKNEEFDFIISSSCFEHIDFFWVSFLEIMRVLKKDGLFYLNAPSNGDFHRYPVDCWRFFPDSGHALNKWGKKNGYNCELIEQYTSDKESDIWSDYVCVFIKDGIDMNTFKNRITNSFENYTNGSIFPHNNINKLKKW
jgi:SAM-dependent methyltransferase